MRSGRRLFVAITVVTLLAAACADDSTVASTTPPDPAGQVTPSTEAPATTVTETSAATAPEPADEPSELLQDLGIDDEPNPLNISFEANDDLGVTVVVTPEGGTVVATDADGTIYTLTIPPDALLADEEISVTPLSTIEGAPFTGAPRGVVLEPEGLVLVKRATLSVEVPGQDPAQLMAAATLADGEDFYLALSESAGSSLTMAISHFSLRIWAQRELIENIRYTYYPATTYARYEDAAVAAGQRIRSADPPLTPEEEEAQGDEASVQLLKHWLNSSLLPSLQSASDLDLDFAIGEAITWAGWAQFYDAMNGDRVIAGQALGAAIDRHAAVAAERCQSDVNDAAQILRWLLITQLLQNETTFNGDPILGSPIGDRDAMKTAVEQCVRFRLEMFSLFDSSDSHFAASLDAVIKVDIETMKMRTRAPLVHEGFSFEGAESCATTTTDGVVDIDFDLIANLSYLSAYPRLTSPNLTIEFIDKPAEKLDCGGGPIDSTLWHAQFIASKSLIGQKPFVILEVVNQGDLFAVRDYMGPVPGLDSEETTQFQLIHEPAG